MQQGRGGMGSKKHGRSGQGGSPSGLKQDLARTANKEADQKKKQREARNDNHQKFDSVSDLMNSRHKK